MATVSICDFCKKVSKECFTHFIKLIYPNGYKEQYEVCEGCVVYLQKALSTDEASLEKQRQIDKPSRTHPIGPPTDALLEHEIKRIPSKRDEVIPTDDNKGCKHKFDMIQTPVGEMLMACVRCNEAINHESFD